MKYPLTPLLAKRKASKWRNMREMLRRDQARLANDYELGGPGYHLARASDALREAYTALERKYVRGR